MTRKDFIAIALLKQASVGEAIGTGIKVLGRGAKRGVHAGANVTGDIVKGLGGGEGAQSLGKVVGGAAVVGGGAEVARRGKRKVEQKVDAFKYRHGLGPYAEGNIYNQQGY